MALLKYFKVCKPSMCKQMAIGSLLVFRTYLTIMVHSLKKFLVLQCCCNYSVANQDDGNTPVEAGNWQATW